MARLLTLHSAMGIRRARHLSSCLQHWPPVGPMVPRKKHLRNESQAPNRGCAKAFDLLMCFVLSCCPAVAAHGCPSQPFLLQWLRRGVRLHMLSGRLHSASQKQNCQARRCTHLSGYSQTSPQFCSGRSDDLEFTCSAGIVDKSDTCGLHRHIYHQYCFRSRR